MTEIRNEFQSKIAMLTIRYHQKSAVIYQSMLFLETAEAVSVSDKNLKKAIDDFEKYLKPNSLDYQHYFSGLLLFSLIADFEIFLVDIVKELIRRYPMKVGAIQFKLSDILSSSPDELISLAAEDYLNRIMYKKPSEYLDDLANILGVDIAPLRTHWPVLVEAKARRDLGIHNSWQINDIYTRKLSEFDLTVPANKKESSLIPDHKYLFAVVEVCDKLVTSIHEQLMMKYE